MARDEESVTPAENQDGSSTKKSIFWRLRNLTRGSDSQNEHPSSESQDEYPKTRPNGRSWSLGILQDEQTEEVPGSILLLPSKAERAAPLGSRGTAAKSHSTVRSRSLRSSGSRPRLARRVSSRTEPKQKTKDGKIILDPQPDKSLNDPLNWAVWRRDVALLSIGFLSMIGGGMTTALAAGFPDVARTYDVSIAQVALTTGLYMLGLGIGNVVASPTAILFGKRPVYLVGCLIFLLSAVWCALSPNYPSLVVARIVMGIAVSPVECLPSASISEIFFLHERAYRLGIYTLLLLGGKNLIPLAGAVIIQNLGWRWVFKVVALVIALCFILLFFFVPETFWDRTPQQPRNRGRRAFSKLRRIASSVSPGARSLSRHLSASPGGTVAEKGDGEKPVIQVPPPAKKSQDAEKGEQELQTRYISVSVEEEKLGSNPSLVIKPTVDSLPAVPETTSSDVKPPDPGEERSERFSEAWESASSGNVVGRLETQSRMNSGFEAKEPGRFGEPRPQTPSSDAASNVMSPGAFFGTTQAVNPGLEYTRHYQAREVKTYLETLKPYNGRLNGKKWLRVAIRPFFLYAYPGVLWSTLVYSLSVGWLIVLSESVATVYQDPATYNFSAIGTGLVYLSPFIGGLLGTVLAGKLSDYLVRYISSLNNGAYEPEFRLFMVIPVAIATVVGLMGFGWSVEEKDNYWVPTVFFGTISFGCTCGSTTAITFVIDSYRQFAGEALVTLNFSKNIFHGLLFSLFFNKWLESEGPKDVFITLGGIQLFFLLFTIPMYIFGKRARMWTARKSFMEWTDK